MDGASKETVELQAILDTMADGVYFVDAQHVVRRWNQSMERLTGYAATEAIGRPCRMLRENHAECAGMGMVDRALSERGLVSSEEVLIRRKDGSQVPILVSARTMTGATGEALGAVITFTDVARLRRLEDENRLLREEARERSSFHNLVGRSPQMREVFRLIELAAASAETILVLGDTGTGKELVAKAIHHHSVRRDAPLVTVNCSALSESLLESELFGHVEGAFTGAIRDASGRFELAESGTIFLDEVGELPPVVQVKLLRFLQERSFERVGEGTPRQADVRVIAATHRELRARVAEGAFREDLFYRLNVFPIRVPPLRERKEDLEPLVERFVQHHAGRTGKRITGFTPGAMRALMDHGWPGNVRELENAVAHAFVTCPGGVADLLDLPLEIRQPEPPQGAALDTGIPLPGTFPKRRRQLTRGQLEETLDATGWNKAEAARRLGVDRTTLWRRMKALGLPLNPGQAVGEE